MCCFVIKSKHVVNVKNNIYKDRVITFSKIVVCRYETPVTNINLILSLRRKMIFFSPTKRKKVIANAPQSVSAARRCVVLPSLRVWTTRSHRE